MPYDPIFPQDWYQTCSESINLTDITEPHLTNPRISLIESLNLEDTYQNLLDIKLILTEPLRLESFFNVILPYVAELYETLTLGDNFDYQFTLARIYSENIELNDIVTKKYPYKLTLVEGLELDDLAYPHKWENHLKTLSDSLTLDDAEENSFYGIEGNNSVYVFDTITNQWTEVEGIEYFKVEKRLNQMSKFTINMPQIETAQKVYVKEYAKVMLFSGLTLILKGRIQKVNYETSYAATIEGFGMEAVILDKEYKNATVSPDDPDRVQYDNESAQTIAKELLSTNATGAFPWTMTPRTTGIFATDYGDISMRYEYANKLTALGNLANALNYDWWIDHDPLTYSKDYFNMATIKGNQTDPSLDVNRQFTITGSLVNAEGTDYQKDVTNIANFVKIIGYGDGINQLFTSTYNASPIWTTLDSPDTSLNGAIDAATATIVVFDTSGFPNSGTILIESEKITYTGKTGTSFTTCTRGAGGTTAVIHSDGVSVLQDSQLTLLTEHDPAYPFPAVNGTIRIANEIITYTTKTGNVYTGIARGTGGSTAKLHRIGCYVEQYVDLSIDPAEAGSSISENGLMELTLTYRDVRDESTLELVASNELIDRMDPIERINIIPTDPNSVAETLETGDLVSVIDAESSLNSNYRIVAIIYENNYGNLSVSLEASNKSLTFIEQMQKEREKNQSLQKYMQGATNVYVVDNSENCDTGYGCEIKTYIPDSTIAINHVKLSYTVSAYRIYASATSADGAHSHNLSGQVTGGPHNHVVNFSVPDLYTDHETNTHSHTANLVSHSHPHGTHTNSSTGSGADTPRLAVHGAHSHMYDRLTNVSINTGASYVVTQSMGQNLVLHSHSINFSTGEQETDSDDNHTHAFTGLAVAGASAHTHNVTYGITPGTNTLSVINIYIDGEDKTAAIIAKIGHTPLSLVSEEDMDITEWITTVGAWHTIDIRPTGTCRIQGELWNQIFIEST